MSNLAAFRSVADIDCTGKTVFFRADLNLPMKDGRSPISPALNGQPRGLPILSAAAQKWWWLRIWGGRRASLIRR